MITLKLTEDNKHLKISDCSLNSERRYIYNYFKKKSPDSDFNPRVDSGEWDGMDHFMTKEGSVPVGLWKEVWNFSEKYGIPVEFDIKPILNKDIDRNEYTKFVDKLFEGILTDKGEPLYPRDYQFEGAFRALKYKFCCEELATSAGKTALFYTYNSYLKYKGIINKDNKALLIVPNVSLVKQTEKAFHQYSNGLVEWNICTIGGKKNEFDEEKFNECDLLITTYQSMLNLVPKCLESRLENLIMKPVKKGKDDARAKEITDVKRRLNKSRVLDICSNFGVVNVDECLHPDTLITMYDGSKKEIKYIKEGEFVKTINDKTFEEEINEVDFVYKNLSKGNQMFEIELENDEIIKITGNHKVKLIDGSYKRVDELNLDDEILSIFD